MDNLEEVSKIFINRIRDLMTDNNLSISKLANDTGIARSTINAWLLGRYNAQLHAVTTFAKYFGVTADYLLGLEN